MSEQFEQDDREVLLRAMAKRVHNREVGVFAGHDDFGTCASCEESVTAVLAAGFHRSPAPQQMSTGECNCGYGGFHEPLNVNCRLYRPEGGESNE